MSRKQYLATKTRQRVVVNTHDERSLRGVLLEVYADCLVLVHAEALTEESAVPIDGEALIERANVSWVQLLPPEQTP